MPAPPSIARQRVIKGLGFESLLGSCNKTRRDISPKRQALRERSACFVCQLERWWRAEATMRLSISGTSRDSSEQRRAADGFVEVRHPRHHEINALDSATGKGGARQTAFDVHYSFEHDRRASRRKLQAEFCLPPDTIERRWEEWRRAV